MANGASVDQTPLVVVSTKIPSEWNDLLEVVRKRRGEAFKSETIRDLIREEIERHLPGSTGEVA